MGAVARTREGAGHVETTLAVLAQQHADHALVLGVILFRGKGAMRARQSSSFAVFVARRGGVRVSIAAHLLHASVVIDHGQQHQRVHHHLLGLPLGHGHRLGVAVVFVVVKVGKSAFCGRLEGGGEFGTGDPPP